MQHDQEGLQINSQYLGDLALSCMAYAKALYYRESEWDSVNGNEKLIESLIALYTKLGQKESANGIYIYAN